MDNLIKLLTPYYQDPEYTEFIDALIDLAYDFDGIEMKYTFVAPTTDAKNKITTINSKSEIVIPIMQQEKVIAVLDVDSEYLNHFDEIDEMYLSKIVALLA